jgi:hypothetical protein
MAVHQPAAKRPSSIAPHDLAFNLRLMHFPLFLQVFAIPVWVWLKLAPA